MPRIMITAGEISLPAELNNSPTARLIWETLPLQGKAQIWGDEIYFEIPVMASQAMDARVEMEVGDLAYWPVGHAFCIFYGPTPVSLDERPRAYSPVNVIGRLLDNAARLRAVAPDTPIRLERRQYSPLND
ncbi:MAG: cyclophilin-like fold protein [Chloroflexota bacterium]